MTKSSSSTADSTSDIADRICRAIRDSIEQRPYERAAHLERLMTRIKDLEARGFIKRQQYSRRTTAEFEREFYRKNRKGTAR